MRIVCISDTHTFHRKMTHPIPDGDVIIHAGDFMSSGWHQHEYIGFLRWYGELPHKHKILIAGNHDRYVEMYNSEFREDVKRFGKITYIQDESCVIDGIKFYGSPWQKWFCDWAFNFPNHEYDPKRAEMVADACWANIPIDTNVLITHGQPFCINDLAPNGKYTGCISLANRIELLKELKLYVGGHIHYCHGSKEIDGVTYINASICNESYEPANAPIVFDLL